MVNANENLPVHIECDADTAAALQQIFQSVPQNEARIVRPRHVHGDATSYYVVGMLLIKEIPVILTQLKALVEALPIRSAVIGGDSIKLATTKQLEVFLKKRSAQRRK